MAQVSLVSMFLVLYAFIKPKIPRSPLGASSIICVLTLMSLSFVLTDSMMVGEEFEWSCDFEGEDGTGSFCGMTQDESLDQFDWTLKSGKTPSGETGPSGAAQGDYYIFIEASNPRKKGDRAL